MDSLYLYASIRKLWLLLLGVTDFIIFLIVQSDNDLSVSGIPLTALFFSYDSHILVSGDESGTVKQFS